MRLDKEAAALEAAPMRLLFGRSLVARHPLPAGHVLTADDLVPKKPGGRVPPTRLEALIGTRLRRALRTDEPLREEDAERVA